MPELPEVQTIVSELNIKLKNRKIKSVTVNAPNMVHLGPATVSNIRKADDGKVAKFKKLLIGHRITSVKRRAKLLIFNFSPTSPRLRRTSGPLSMLVHLKMTGQFIFEDKQQRQKTGGKYRILNKLTAPLVELPCKYTHVIFRFTDGSTLYFNDLRQFGYLKLVRDDEINQVKELQQFGPEPLDKKFTFAVFQKQIERYQKRTIKQALTDPELIAGIGNIYSDEILFHAKVRPTRVVLSIKNKELSSIYKWIKPVLEEGIKAKGSSVGDFVRTDGTWGQMGKFHFVYGRKGKKCKRCGTIVEAVKLGGRTGSFCPSCQK